MQAAGVVAFPKHWGASLMLTFSVQLTKTSGRTQPNWNKFPITINPNGGVDRNILIAC